MPGGSMQDVNCLWAHATSPGGGILAFYPSLFEEMLETARSSGCINLPHLLLPSDPHWQDKIYYKLVTHQRQLNIMPSPAATVPVAVVKHSAWDTRTKSRCSNSAPSPKTTYSSELPQALWTAQDISKAARMLARPPHEARFASEHDMRNVYTLIYDVFRYRNVLQQALEDANFFRQHPEIRGQQQLIWLIMYELQVRRWRENAGRERTECDRVFRECDCCGVPLTQVQNAVWSKRVKLAAAIARFRIARNALKLSELLPLHLRDERVARCSRLAPVTAWINKNLVDQPIDAACELRNLDLLPGDAGTQLTNQTVPENRYAWDSLCPMFIRMGCGARATISESTMVREHRLVLQERSFCYGPAMLCKLLYEYDLSGAIVLTHVTSPRTVAYLGTLLAQNEKAFSLIAFGAGDRRQEYEEYLSRLRVPHVLINSRSFIQADLKSELFENVVAVLATPPNSYSAVLDPVDLVMGMSAGGVGKEGTGEQLAMLELLTDTEQTDAGKTRVKKMLTEQLDTLTAAMSRPQVQFVLYETHSQLPAENQLMAWQALRDLNRAVRLQIAERKGLLPEQKTPRYMQNTHVEEINNNLLEAGTSKDAEEQVLRVTTATTISSTSDGSDDLDIDVEVPTTDCWEQEPVPDLCFNADSCVRMREEGCFLALLRRKEISHFDSKQMIKMAEARGLFGAAMDPTKHDTNTPATIVKKRQNKGRPKTTARRGSFHVERIAAQTHSSLIRSVPAEVSKESVPLCPRHKVDKVTSMSPARQWWAETTRYLTRLRRSLVRQKLLPSDAVRALLPEEDLVRDIRNIDEILKNGPSNARLSTLAHIPVFPRLRLSRQMPPPERIPFPLYNCSVELPERRYL